MQLHSQDGFVGKQNTLVQNNKWSEFLSGILGSTKALLAAPKAGLCDFIKACICQPLASFRQKTTFFSALCCALADAVSYYTIAFDFLSRVTPAERKDLVVNVCAELVDPKIEFTGGDGDGPTLRIQL